MQIDPEPAPEFRPDAEPVRKRRASLLVPVPAALMGLGLLSGAPVAQAQATFARDDFFRVLPDTVTALPVMANDTVPNTSSTVGLWVPPTTGNVIPRGTFFDFVPPPGFRGAASFEYCIYPIDTPNNCALVTLSVEPPPTPVPALGAAGLAGLAGMLGWLGLRRSRRS